jgi:hypothetical protein
LPRKSLAFTIVSIEGLGIAGAQVESVHLAKVLLSDFVEIEIVFASEVSYVPQDIAEFLSHLVDKQNVPGAVAQTLLVLGNKLTGLACEPKQGNEVSSIH